MQRSHDQRQPGDNNNRRQPDPNAQVLGINSMNAQKPQKQGRQSSHGVN